MILQGYNPNINTQEYLKDLIFSVLPEAIVNTIIPYQMIVCEDENKPFIFNPNTLYFGKIIVTGSSEHQLTISLNDIWFNFFFTPLPDSVSHTKISDIDILFNNLTNAFNLIFVGWKITIENAPVDNLDYILPVTNPNSNHPLNGILFANPETNQVQFKKVGGILFDSYKLKYPATATETNVGLLIQDVRPYHNTVFKATGVKDGVSGLPYEKEITGKLCYYELDMTNPMEIMLTPKQYNAQYLIKHQYFNSSNWITFAEYGTDILNKDVPANIAALLMDIENGDKPHRLVIIPHPEPLGNVVNITDVEFYHPYP